MVFESEPSLIAATEDWWVVDKPAGWLSVPGRSTRPTLVDWLRQKHGNAWVIHRLDEGTSGVILFGRSADSHRKACDWFFNHQVRKVYEFLATGSPSLPVFRVNTSVEGKSASTQIEVVKRWSSPQVNGPIFWGRARPVTGRRHQIRIHLAESGFPLLGDARYGGAVHPIEGLEVSRVALHARSLSLPTGEVFESSLSEDFLKWVEWLEDSQKGGAS